MGELNDSVLSMPRMPVVFVPHGGGPMPLLDDPEHRELIAFLKKLGRDLPQPHAILMISAHWEEPVASVSSASAPGMIYDYNGFPPESYLFRYPAPGNPILAQHIVSIIEAAGLPARLDPVRGYDHGTFVPLMLMFPAANIPVVQISLIAGLEPAAHIALGKALALLREQGVLIIGSGMSFHNMRAFFSSGSEPAHRSEQFDLWLTQTLTGDLSDNEREQQLAQWSSAPEARYSHPREEHLLPLHVCFGAASGRSAKAQKIFGGQLMDTFISAFLWD